MPLLNGLEHMDVLRARFDGRVAAASISHFQAYRAGRVQIVEGTMSPVVTLASESLPRSEVEHAADLLRRGRIDVRVGQNEKRVLWHKLARIAALAAATSAVRSHGRRAPLRQGVAPAAREGRIARRVRSQRPTAYRCSPRSSGRSSTTWPDETTTSAARDVAAGRRSELDAILGSVLRAADRLGVPCPTLNELAASAGLR